MKKVIIFSVAAVIAVSLMFTGILTAEKKSGFNIWEVTADKLKKLNITESLDGVYRIESVKCFGYTGDAEFKIKGDSISAVKFLCGLEYPDNVNAAEKTVKNFVAAYSRDFSFTFQSEPTVVPFTDGETYKDRPDNKYDALINGFDMLEYSYRDKDGILWLAQIYSPTDCKLTASVTKINDETGYEDYEPQIDMRED